MRALKPLPSRRSALTESVQSSSPGTSPTSADHKVTELLDDYYLRCGIRGFSPKTVKLYRDDLGSFGKFLHSLGVTRLRDIGHQHVEGFMRAAQERGCSPHSVHRLYRNVRAFLRDAARLYEGYVPPTEKVRPPRLPTLAPKALSIEQIQTLLDACAARARKGGRIGSSARRDAFFIRFTFDSGLRLAEALSVRLEDIDDATGTILIRHGKGGQPRTLMIGQKTLWELRRHVRSLPTGSTYLFPGKCGQKPVQAERLRKRLGELGERSGIHVSPHRLRHGCARDMCLNGASIPVIQARLGHTTPAMTLHYARLFTSDTLEEGKRFSPGDRL